MQVDIKVAQLLSSRICHDLAGLSGAIHAGVEMMVERAAGSGEALELAHNSSAELVARLAFLRAAFGFGGIDSQTKLSDTMAIAEDYFSTSKVSLQWDCPQDLIDAPMASVSAKLLLNLLLLAVSALPRGGQTHAQFAKIDGELGVAILAEGVSAGFDEALKAAISPDLSDLSVLNARNIHGYFAVKLAESNNTSIEINELSPGEVHLAILLP